MKKLFIFCSVCCVLSCTTEEVYITPETPQLLVVPEVCAKTQINQWSPEAIAYITLYANQPLGEWNLENWEVVEYSIRYKRLSSPFYQRITYIDPLLFSSLDSTLSVSDASPWRFVSARGVKLSIPSSNILTIFTALESDPILLDGVYIQIRYKVNGTWGQSTLSWITIESSCTGIFPD